MNNVNERSTKRNIPSNRQLYYKDGYKYQVKEDITIDTNMSLHGELISGKGYRDEYMTLYLTGILVIRAGYAWDGASGVPDTKRTLRASLAHDAMYQMLREGIIPQTLCDMGMIDDMFMRLCVEDGLPRFIARMYYWGLRLVDCKYARKARRKITKTTGNIPYRKFHKK